MGVTVAALCTLLLIDTMEECRGGCDMVYRAKGRGVSGPADKRDGASRVVSFQLGELYAEHGGLVGFTRLDRTLRNKMVGVGHSGLAESWRSSALTTKTTAHHKRSLRGLGPILPQPIHVQ